MSEPANLDLEIEIYEEDRDAFAAGEKATWSTAYVNRLPDSAFLYVGTGGSKDSDGKTTPRSLRKFPVTDANGNPDRAHITNAIARIPQASGLSQQQKDSLQSKARSMLNAMNKGQKDMHAGGHADYRPWGGAQSFSEWHQMKEAYATEGAIGELTYTFQMLVDNILRDDMMPFERKPDAIIALAQELKREIQPAVEKAVANAKEVDDSGLPETREGLIDRVKSWFHGRPEAPAAIPQSTFRMFKQADGTMRWIAVWSNAAKDRDEERFPLSAHKEFIGWCDETGFRPDLQWWHVPGTKMGQAEMLAITDEGFTIAEGTIDAGAKAQAEKLMAGELGPLAVSHGYVFEPSDLVNGEYKRYRSFEISVLPAAKAANPFTGWTAGQEVPMITDAEKRASLVSLWGEDATKELEANLARTAARMKEEGIDFKEVMDAALEGAMEAAGTAPGGTQTGSASPPAQTSGEGGEIVKALEALSNQVAAIAQDNKAIRSEFASFKAASDKGAGEGGEWAQRNRPAFLASTSPGTAIAGSKAIAGDPDNMSDQELIAAAAKAASAPGLSDEGKSKAESYLGDLGIKVAP